MLGSAAVPSSSDVLDKEGIHADSHQNGSISSSSKNVSMSQPGKAKPATTTSTTKIGQSNQATSSLPGTSSTTAAAPSSATTTATLPSTPPIHDQTTAAIAQLEEQKRAQRAARFGLPVPEADKIKERAARFGQSLAPPKATAPATNNKPTKTPVVLDEVAEKKKAERAARFGLPTTPAATPATTAATTTTTTAKVPDVWSFLLLCNFSKKKKK